MDYCSAAIKGEKITIISNRDFWIESFWATSRYLWLKAMKKLTLEFLSCFVGHNPDWTVTNFNLNFTISGCHGYSFDHLFFFSSFVWSRCDIFESSSSENEIQDHLHHLLFHYFLSLRCYNFVMISAKQLHYFRYQERISHNAHFLFITEFQFFNSENVIDAVFSSTIIINNVIKHDPSSNKLLLDSSEGKYWHSCFSILFFSPFLRLHQQLNKQEKVVVLFFQFFINFQPSQFSFTFHLVIYYRHHQIFRHHYFFGFQYRRIVEGFLLVFNAKFVNDSLHLLCCS